MEWISQPWPWYVAGPMITFIVVLLLIFGNKPFGISNTLRTACAAGGAGNHCGFFQFNWKADLWNLVFIAGIAIGGIIASTFMGGAGEVQISQQTISDLKGIGVQHFDQFLPTGVFSFQNLMTWQGFMLMVVGGFLVGFGARYAGGCTSGHAIMGLGNLQPASLLAVVGFFIGGLLVTHLVLPFII